MTPHCRRERERGSGRAFEGKSEGGRAGGRERVRVRERSRGQGGEGESRHHCLNRQRTEQECV